MEDAALRESARRQHRAVLLFAVIQSWLRGWDGLVIDRSPLERLLGLKRFKQARIQWFEEDAAEFFTDHRTFWSDTPSNSFKSIIVSRKSLAWIDSLNVDSPDFETNVLDPMHGLGALQIWNNSEKLQKHLMGLAPIFANSSNFDERFLCSYLALLAQGHISPKDHPPI